MPSAPQTPSQSAYSTQSGATQNTCSTFSRKKRKSFADRGQEYVGPKDKGFQDDILVPLGVRLFYSKGATAKLIDTFGTQSPAPESRVIIRKEEKELEEIKEDFAAYEAQGYDENALTTICYDSIVLRDRFINVPVVGEDQSGTTSVRRDKWKPNKKDGPQIQTSKYIYDWDIEPDTTYAVSTRIFNVKHREELDVKECRPWVAENAAVCPYLTIEYKCSDKSGKSSDARNQVTAASVLWLNQRKHIRQALGLSIAGLRHFSITIIDSNYTIWEARFKDDLYYIHNLIHGDLTTLDGLKLYIEWSNAIHTWGLGPNASSFKEDIIACLDHLHNRQQPFPTPPSMHSSADTVQGSTPAQSEGKANDGGYPAQEVFSNSIFPQ